MKNIRVNCKICGKEFELWQSRLSELGNCCSKKCDAIKSSQKKRPENIKAMVNRVKELRILEPERWRKIAIDSLPKDCSGEKSGNWRGGVTKLNYNWRTQHLQEYKKWRSEIIKRDKCCKTCGSTEKLTAHHIFEISYFKDIAFELWNGVTLCRKCHMKTDSWGGHKKDDDIGNQIYVRIIPKHYQEFDTLGNYKKVNDNVYFLISDTGNDLYNKLIFCHELIEQTLIEHRGIPEPLIDKWDKEHPELDEPGDHPDAPYHAEHIIASSVEQLMCNYLNIRADY